MTDKKSLLSAIIAGAAVGTAAGVLIAPKPGKVTRRYIGSRAGKLRLKIQPGKTLNKTR